MNPTAETLDLAKGALSVADDVLKSFVQPGSATTGFQLYNLKAPSLKFYPVATPLRNDIARVDGGFAIQANWKAVTGINVGNTRAGISEGHRGGIIQHTLAEYFASFRGFGLENFNTFEAGYAAKGFEDVRATGTMMTMQSTMIQEERLILGGNTSLALGTTPTPTLSTANTGGTIAAATQSVICVALSFQAYLDVVGVNNGAINQSFSAATTAVPGLLTRVNAGGTSDTFGGGSAAPSASATVVTSGAASTVTASVAATNGAVGYAWYIGPVGSERLAAVTSTNSVVLTAPAPGGAQLASALVGDNSTCSLDFDGLLTMAFKLGGYQYVMPTGTAGIGTPLTSDGATGIQEIDTALRFFFDKYRFSPTKIMVSSQENTNITKKIVGNGGAVTLVKFDVPVDANGIKAGARVTHYLNKSTGEYVPFEVHPNMPAGTMLFYTDSLPYPVQDMPAILRMLMRQDYYQIDWPLVDRAYRYGVYADGVLQHFAPFSLGVITNIANG